MEITQDNFFNSLELISESIDEADFIAIDTEFSGYTADPDDAWIAYDTTENRYQKLRSKISKFVAFQVGICTYKWDDETKKYKYRPFSFYVWPKSKIQDRSMMFQSGAVSFLVQNNFDFNKTFDKGINYGRYTDQANIKSLCRQKVTKNFESVRSYSVLSKTHQQDLADMLKEVEEFVYDPTAQQNLVFQIQSYALKKALSKKVTELYMNTGIFTEFQRQHPETIVKKSKSFKQVNFLRDIRPSQENRNPSPSKGSESPSAFPAILTSPVQSGKNTAATVTLQNKVQDLLQEKEPVFGFCDENGESEKESLLQLEDASKASSSVKILGDNKDKNESEEIEIQINNLFRYEIGFSRVMEQISKSKKPVIGHNMIYDIAFMYHQFFKPLPETYAQFADSVNRDFLPNVYDTKTLSLHAGSLAKSDLQYLYKKCSQDKKYNNNLCFEADCKNSHPIFSVYEQNGGQGHDAGFDAFMTGLVFATLSKFIEIGKIVTRSTGQDKTPPSSQSSNKRLKKIQEKGKDQKEGRNIKHFSAVQNKEIYLPDVQRFNNLVMMEVEVPAYWYLDPSNTQRSEGELDFENKLHQNVVYVKLKKSGQQDEFGRPKNIPTVHQISDLFTKFGDIQIIKDTQYSCFIEFQDIDQNFVTKGKAATSVAQQIIKTVKTEIKKKNQIKDKLKFADLIEDIGEYKDHKMFVYDGETYEGGF